jgi:hypothetical protein
MHLSRLRRIALAAVRLAAMYAATAGLLFVLVILAMERSVGALRVLRVSWAPVGAAFLLVLLVLAVARKIGFALLWALLFALWVRTLTNGGHLFLPVLFIFWTVGAAPLYALIAIALQDEAHSTRGVAGLVRRWGLIIGWAVLVVAALSAPTPTSSEWGLPVEWRPVQLLWASMPLIVALSSVWQLRRLGKDWHLEN